MKILFVSAVYPHAAEYGAQLRVLNLCRQLAKIGKLSIALICRGGIDQEAVEKTRSEFELAHLAQVLPDTLTNLSDRLRFELDPTYLNTHFSTVSERDRAELLRLIRLNDVVWVHTLRTANECRIFRWPHTVLDMDDIPSRLYTTVARNGSRVVRRCLDYRMSLIWRRRERLIGQRFDVVSVCSDEDREYLRDSPKIQTVPNGFAPPITIPNRVRSLPPLLGFIGWFRWVPNVDGIRWFLERVWPLVKRDVPDARLRVVGGGSDRDFFKAFPDVDYLGYVDDPSAEIAGWSAMIVPIRIGGGTRIKIAQAFSLRCPVVSTSLGAFGYEVASGREIMLADRADDFAGACVRLIQNEELAREVAENAWEAFLKRWTWDAMGRPSEVPWTSV